MKTMLQVLDGTLQIDNIQYASLNINAHGMILRLDALNENYKTFLLQKNELLEEPRISILTFYSARWENQLHNLPFRFPKNRMNDVVSFT
ncbi:hypothetical protein GDO86_002986 [Hymenochirus boettgeri]|uniref:Uncharacterized protein n=1 Tax=Hymenochirus boettgeri TaxID=247094 RepID=A0A8T2K1Q8_9PIPI|nr:hypothetical protein GDO86_002986 [Hymenochirus boettgeri]